METSFPTRSLKYYLVRVMEINNELDNKSLEWKKLINFKFGNNMTVRGFAGYSNWIIEECWI